MIEDITNDVLKKLLLTTSKDSEDFVGIENHIVEMSSLLHLESEEVRMVGIWGASGIGKTTIARALYGRLSSRFQGSVFIDKAFIYKSMKIYDNANSDDYNMKLHLQRTFLSKILDKKEIEIDHLGAVEERLKHQKVLIFIDDSNDQVVLDALVGETHWFGGGSRIIVITKDKHFLRAHGIDHIYEVGLPSEKLAFEMFCRSAFKINSPPKGLMELASEVSLRAGNLPLGINVLGSYLRGRDKESLMKMLPSLRDRLNGKIEKTLRVSYDGLNSKKDKSLFRHIACLFNGESVNNIKLLLADSHLDVTVGLESLVDKSFIHIRERDMVEMHDLLQNMGKEIVCAQSDEPGEREFLVDSKEICYLLEDNNGTKKVLGIALDMNEIDELHIHENAFKEMPNLRFLDMYTKNRFQKKEVRWYIPQGFNYLPPKLRLLRLVGYPMRRMPSNFCFENLVKFQMRDSKLEKLWDGVLSLPGLREIDLEGSKSLIEIPDLSMATNLETLRLNDCWSLVELASSIQYLNKLNELDMSGCKNLETLPTGMNLQSLNILFLRGCSRLKSFPDISTNILSLVLDETSIDEFYSVLHLKKLRLFGMRRMKTTETLWGRDQPITPLMTMLSPTLTRLFLSDIPSLVELPSSIQKFKKLDLLAIIDCINLDTLPSGINCQSLYSLQFTGCKRLKTFPDISTNISQLYLDRTGIEEVPWWIEKFFKLEELILNGCNSLLRVTLNIYKLKKLGYVDISDWGALAECSWTDNPREVAMATDNIHSKLPDDTSSPLPDEYFQNVGITFKCFNLDPEAILHQRSIIFKELRMSGEEMPSYFTHRTTATSSSLTIPLLKSSLSQPFFRFRACAVVDFDFVHYWNRVYIHVDCVFKGRFGNSFDYFGHQHHFVTDKTGSHLFIFECRVPLNKDNAPLAQQNYDHVDMQLHISNKMNSTSREKILDPEELRHWNDISAETKFKLKGCGIRLAEDCSSSENQLGHPNTLPQVNETEHGEEVEDSSVDTERRGKRIRIT